VTPSPEPALQAVVEHDVSLTTSAAPTVRDQAAKTFALCVPVLEYHRIVPSAEAGDSLPGLVISPDLFSAQMDALKAAGWHTITLATLGDDLLAGRAPPAKSFVVSIDDGWYDGYTRAFPILKAHGLVATFFVISSRIGANDFLSASDLTSLIAAGDEIGNHTVDHVSLPYLTRANMTSEVNLASDRIAKVTGVRPKSFAYPMGGITTSSMAVVAACPGMEIAVTEQKAIGETNAGRFDVPRLEIGPDVSAQSLLAMLAG
jgi:peptidoglycan/xylan/chitin deacetylase (PgdA/CDA1 family)